MQPIAKLAGSWHVRRFPVARPCFELLTIATAVLMALLSPSAPAQTAGEVTFREAQAAARARAQQEFRQTRAAYQTETNRGTASWQFARACFDLAEFATNKAQRAQLAEAGIAAARNAIAHRASSAPGHYYLGMNLGQLARTRTLGALRLVDEMETAFETARVLDETFDHAGPDRNLGLLFWQAPVIGSIGNRSEARRHLARAVLLAPDYPENRLTWIEALLDWGDTAGARREFNRLEGMWPELHKNLAGEQWALSWFDWGHRFQTARKRVNLRPVHSPHHQE